MLNIKRALLSLIPTSLRGRMRTAYWKVRKRMSVERASMIDIAPFGDFRLAYRKDTADEEVILQFLGKNCYFSETNDYRPDEDHVIIDIGAHIGAFALHASSHVPRGKVYAIEACKETYNLLCINTALNNITNIEASHLALSDYKGTCQLSHGSANWGFTIVARKGRRGETVASDTLSGFLQSAGISRCHLLKMNCEGAEFPILLSSEPSTLQTCERIVVRYHTDLWRENTKEELFSHLQSSGFHTALKESSECRGTIIARLSR